MEEKEVKKNKSLWKKILLVILDILVILLACYFIIAYVNFKKISNNEEPILIASVEEYEQDNHHVKVYNGVIYRIVYDEIPGDSVVLKLKLWFMEDIG